MTVTRFAISLASGALLVTACTTQPDTGAGNDLAAETDRSAPPPPPPPPPMAAYSDSAAAQQKMMVTGRMLGAPVPEVPVNRERYEDVEANPVKRVSEEAVSTFSIDVDTAAYSNVRRMLRSGTLPPADAVRIEELINYFDYDYGMPETGDHPFKPSVTVVPSPWADSRELMHIGIQGLDIPEGPRPAMNLTMLMDVSGSMNSADKLPLAKTALRELIPQLTEEDTISIVVYAGAAGQVLAPTSGDNKDAILDALDSLSAGGSTAGGAGLQLAYDLTEENFDEDAVNRVMLLTDGDFNVGNVDDDSLESFIERKRKSGIYLSIMGFGTGNYNDQLMQTLSQAGNGIAGYVDTEAEARKLFADDLAGNMFPIADDVKIQVEFNPAAVAEYRLIGYETRMLNREDFNNDAVDAGDIGAGTSVTAIYEIARAGSDGRLIDESRYDDPAPTPNDMAGELAYLKLRYKAPGDDDSVLITRPITEDDAVGSLDRAPVSTRFATAVAGFGQALRNDPYLQTGYSWGDIRMLAKGAVGTDEFGYRAEFLELVDLASEAADMNSEEMPRQQR